jgi:hypothetical protein
VAWKFGGMQPADLAKRGWIARLDRAADRVGRSN